MFDVRVSIHVFWITTNWISMKAASSRRTQWDEWTMRWVEERSWLQLNLEAVIRRPTGCWEECSSKNSKFMAAKLMSCISRHVTITIRYSMCRRWDDDCTRKLRNSQRDEIKCTQTRKYVPGRKQPSRILILTRAMERATALFCNVIVERKYCR